MICDRRCEATLRANYPRARVIHATIGTEAGDATIRRELEGIAVYGIAITAPCEPHSSAWGNDARC